MGLAALLLQEPDLLILDEAYKSPRQAKLDLAGRLPARLSQRLVNDHARSPHHKPLGYKDYRSVRRDS